MCEEPFKTFMIAKIDSIFSLDSYLFTQLLEKVNLMCENVDRIQLASC